MKITIERIGKGPEFQARSITHPNCHAIATNAFQAIGMLIFYNQEKLGIEIEDITKDVHFVPLEE